MNKIVVNDDHDNEDGERRVVILKANKVRKLFVSVVRFLVGLDICTILNVTQ